MKRVGKVWSRGSRHDAKARKLLSDGETVLRDAQMVYDVLNENATTLLQYSYWPSLDRMDFSHDEVDDEEVRTKLQLAAGHYASSVRIVGEDVAALDTWLRQASSLPDLVTSKSLRDRLTRMAARAKRTAGELDVLPHAVTLPGGPYMSTIPPELVTLGKNWLKQKQACVWVKVTGSVKNAQIGLLEPQEMPDPFDDEPLAAPEVWQRRREARMQDETVLPPNHTVVSEGNLPCPSSVSTGQGLHSVEPYTHADAGQSQSYGISSTSDDSNPYRQGYSPRSHVDRHIDHLAADFGYLHHY